MAEAAIVVVVVAETSVEAARVRAVAVAEVILAAGFGVDWMTG